MQPPGRGAPLISNDTLRQLYVAMLRCRALEERTRALASRKKLVQSPIMGQQEATIAAVAADLLPDDTIAPSEGSFIADFLRGAPLHETVHAIERLIAANSPAKPRRSSRHAGLNDDSSNIVIPPPSVAAQLSIATGAALANSLRQTADIVVVFVRGGWTSGGVEEEILHFAGTHALPILYVVQDRSDRAPANAARGDYGLPSIPVDDNDLVALYRVAHEGIKRARQGGGPTLMDCKLCGREQQLERDRSETDPVARMERYLATRKIFSQDWKRQTVRAFKAELDAAMARARRA